MEVSLITIIFFSGNIESPKSLEYIVSFCFLKDLVSSLGRNLLGNKILTIYWKGVESLVLDSSTQISTWRFEMINSILIGFPATRLHMIYLSDARCIQITEPELQLVWPSSHVVFLFFGNAHSDL